MRSAKVLLSISIFALIGICMLNFSSISKINETTSIESSPRLSSDSDKSSVPPVWLVLAVIISTMSSAALGIFFVIRNEARHNGPVLNCVVASSRANVLPNLGKNEKQQYDCRGS